MAALSAVHAVLQSNIILKWLRQLPSWRNFVILLLLINIKSLPLAWHVRIFYYLFKNLNFRRHTHPKLKERFTKRAGNSGAHPLFTPVSVMSHTSLMEIDYNLHKSNSTYFSDLDISRTALVTDICTPGLEICRRELDKVLDDTTPSNGNGNANSNANTGKPLKKKYPGKIAVFLGSVYCSFKKEIPPYERYEMQSRIAGWDEKWLYVVTYFLRPARRRGERRTVLAVGISQYVIKKGRLTLKPAKVLNASGLIPDRPADAGPSPSTSTASTASSSAPPSRPSSSSNGPKKACGVVSPVSGTPSSVEAINASEGLDGNPVVREVLALTERSDMDQAALENEKREKTQSWDQDEWTWERIEERRVQGLETVRAFIGLDAKLLREVEGEL
ncbi:conserved hypothetical protein [Histoplasma capsulatum G186AR]|uniref:Capsule polysaccharide biosynthesis protein n=2 Tax=Ajellomyces capsulatus TaxID=5037 RepID=C0NJ68_AJECG|nr:uncharacterized protein HCBG_03198 [Histoplasma capsulatum G186AR]EEH07909.1 conserved hypothetical protein [Histoplasma capsulatum G186AR]KAG5299759.1 hot_dog superfamily domain-containing protein [Histoplasma capsulatum]QSS67614.1 hot_dog superfamily domain-containing protein [Histoplasma capsulatum G186AR]